MHMLPREDLFQAIERQVVVELADRDKGDQPRPGESLVDRLLRLRGGDNLRRVPCGIARLAGIFMADVPQHFEAGRQVFELLADLLADTATGLAAARTRLLFFAKVVFDLDPRQMLRQRAAAMRMTLPRAARLQRLACFLFNARLRQRQLIDPLAEEQQLSRIERFVLGSIESLEQRGGRRLDRRLDGLLDGNFDGAVDGRLLVGDYASQLCFALRDDPLQDRRIIGQLAQIERRRNVRAHTLCMAQARARFRSAATFSESFQLARLATTSLADRSCSSCVLSMVRAASLVPGKRNTPRSSRL